MVSISSSPYLSPSSNGSDIPLGTIFGVSSSMKMMRRYVSHSGFYVLIPLTNITLVVYVCPTCQEKTGRRTVSKCQKTTCNSTIPLSPSVFLYSSILSCNNPRLRLLVPCSLQYVLVLVRCHCASLELHRPRRELHTPSLNDALWSQRSQTRRASRLTCCAFIM
jgi:hypothetical protein